MIISGFHAALDLIPRVKLFPFDAELPSWRSEGEPFRETAKRRFKA